MDCKTCKNRQATLVKLNTGSEEARLPVDTLPDKPTGCAIEESVDPEGVTLSWPTPSPGPVRYAVAAFIAFWLCAWAFGWIAAATQIARGNGPELFLVGWLGAWT